MRVNTSCNSDRRDDRKNDREFEGLESALKGIRQLGPDLGYFILRDFSIGGAQQQLESVDFEPDALASFLLSTSRQHIIQAELDDGDTLELDDEFFSDAHDGNDTEPADDTAPPASYAPGTSPINAAPLECTHAMLLEAVCRWLLAAAARATETAPAMRLRVQAYAVKGSRVVFTASFWCRNPGYRADWAELAQKAGEERQTRDAQGVGTRTTNPGMTAPAPAPISAEPVPSTALVPVSLPQRQSNPMPPPPPEMLIYPAGYQDGTLFGTIGAFQALNNSYVQFGDAVMGGVATLQAMMNQMLTARGEELLNCRQQVDRLITEVLDHRVQEVEAQTQAVQVQSQDQRTALARDALQQIGETSRAFFVSRGISPEAAELLNSFSGNPELMSALQEPEVKALIQDPANQQALLTLLRQAAAKHQAMKGGGSSSQSMPVTAQAPLGGIQQAPQQPPQQPQYKTSPTQPQYAGYPPPYAPYPPVNAGGFAGSHGSGYPPSMNPPHYPPLQPYPPPQPSAAPQHYAPAQPGPYAPMPGYAPTPPFPFQNPAPMAGPPPQYPPQYPPHYPPQQAGPYPGAMPGQVPIAPQNQARAWSGNGWPVNPGQASGAVPPPVEPQRPQTGGGQPPASSPSKSGESLEGSPKSP